MADSMMTWKTSRAGTWKKSSVTVPFTSSVTTMLTRYCWDSSRSVVCTLASRRLSVMGSAGSLSRQAPWAVAAGSDGNSVRTARPSSAKPIRIQDTMVSLTS
ncbi:MAG TPA: hypothetical protein DCQ64_14630 [Candidatus Rokubacteria bacterium]|nr:hypothetical protein [Candidatus Rokubacteria bacterium]